MANNFLPVCVVFTVALLAALPASAQDCKADYELIFEMRKKEYGSYHIWDAVYGEDSVDERFVSGVVIDSGHAVAAGERLSFGTSDTDLVLVEFEQRGRPIWEEAHKVKGLRQVKKMLALPSGFLVMGARQDEKKKSVIWLGFFDEKGKLVQEKNIAAPKGALLPEDIIPANGTQGFVIAASAGSEAAGLFHAVIYEIDPKGRVLSDHAYLPGLDNRVFGLAPNGKDFYMASGYLRGEDGRKTGWLLKLNKDGGIVWQRQYPRGRAAHINLTADMIYDYVLAVGQSVPSGKGTRAAWVMMIDAGTGNVVWQRYYTGELHYEAKDVLISPDHLASVLLDGRRPDGTEEEEFIRILTVNPRGVLHISDEYFHGEGAQAFRMAEGNAGERVVFGSTNTVYRIENDQPGGEDKVIRSLDGWAFAATAAEPYDDPCVQPYSFLP